MILRKSRAASAAGISAALWLLACAAPALGQPGADPAPRPVLLPPPNAVTEILPVLQAPQPQQATPKQVGKKNPPEEKKTPVEAEPEKKETEAKEEAKEALKEGEKKEAQPAWYSAHVQATVIGQGNWMFHSPYQGPNSFVDAQSLRTTATSTLFLAAKLPWEGGLVVLDPEVAGGQGLSGTFGMGGFPNGEAVRVGDPTPTPYIARLYYQQDFGLGGPWEKLEDGPNQVAGHRDINRITIQIGRLPATDLFDQNTYSHDPRTQFMNWTLMYNGAWDYPANTRGYNYGGTIELNTPFWAIRYGVFAEPEFANGFAFDNHYLMANGHALEMEYRWNLDGPQGKLRLLAYANHAHMGDYREALDLMPVNPDVTATREYRWKYGFGLNLEQALTRDLGLFARLGWDDGHTETWAFTEVDRTASLGLLLKGRRWGRPQDQVGLAGVLNGLSQDHRDYLAAGGLGFELGDGKLNYGLEQIVETYYDWQVRQGIYVTLDFQEVGNPGYNRDRGPVSVMALRFHFEY
jgi:high affinity Mn2+ porin